MGSDLARRLGAEFIGTALLVFVGAGAFVGAVSLSNGKLTYAAIGFIALAEGLGTYFVMLTVMALAIDTRAPSGWAGLIIGLAVAGEIMIIGPLTSGSVNPARTTGPYLMTAIFGNGPPWGQYFIYWVGPCAGAVAAALTYDLIMRPRRSGAEDPNEPPPAGGGERDGRDGSRGRSGHAQGA